MSTKEWMDLCFEPASTKGWRGHMFRVIFPHHEPDECRFDIILLGVIVVSMLVALPEALHGCACTTAKSSMPSNDSARSHSPLSTCCA